MKRRSMALKDFQVLVEGDGDDSFLESKDFFPYKTPPDFRLAKIHGLSRRVCKPIRHDLYKSEVCSCCGLPVENEQLEICCRTESLIHLGVCFPLYFSYIKFFFAVLSVCFVSAGAYNIYTNWKGTNCVNGLGSDSMICKLSFINLLGHTQEILSLQKQSNMNNLAFLLTLALFELFRRYQKKLIRTVSQEVGISDFSVFLSDVPGSFTNADIQILIDFHLQSLGHPSATVIQVYHLSDISEYAEEYARKRKLIISKCKGAPDQQSLNQLIFESSERLKEIERRNLQNFDVQGNNGQAIVVLNSSSAAKVLAKKFKKTRNLRISIFFSRIFRYNKLIQKYLYEGQYIKINKASEPSEVLWENVGLKPGIKFWRKALTAVVLAILILIGFSLLLLMKKKLKLIQPSSNDPETDHYVSIIISFLASTFVALINTTLGIFIRKFARYERHKTQSNYFVSTGRRLTACLVINMCFTTVLANMVHSEKAESIFTFWRISVTGLFFDIFFLFVTNSYMSSIFNIFDLLWVFRIIKRYRAQRQGINCPLTQIEANKLFEGHPVDMALRYANVNKTAIFTGIFAPFIPCGIVFSLLGLLICYWVDKYLLLRRYVSVNRLSKNLPLAMFHTAQWFLISFSFGNLFIFFLPSSLNGMLVFRKKISDYHFWISVATFSFALIYKWFLPMNKINKDIFRDKHEKQPDLDYWKYQGHFPENYEAFHPIFKRRNMILTQFRADHEEGSPVKKPEFTYKSLEGYLEKILE